MYTSYQEYSWRYVCLTYVYVRLRCLFFENTTIINRFKLVTSKHFIFNYLKVTLLCLANRVKLQKCVLVDNWKMQ